MHEVPRGVNVTAIIQARMSSVRLPGKVLLDICGKPLLEHFIQRVSVAESIQRIIVATTKNVKDRAIIEFAQKHGITHYVGSEDDVLDRFYRAARQYAAKTIVRITPDNPFIDPQVIDRVVNCYLSSENLDYVSNRMKPTYPEGLDVEVFSFTALERAWKKAKKPSEREHVTPYIWNHPELFQLANVANDQDFSYMRWTLDTEADLRFTQEVYSRLYRGQIFVMKDILTLLHEEPQLQQMNYGVARDEGYLESLERDRTI